MVFMNRKFVPENLNVDNVEDVTRLFETLLNENIPNSPDALRTWILKWSELGSVLAEVSSRRYVAMTVNTQRPPPRHTKTLSEISTP